MYEFLCIYLCSILQAVVWYVWSIAHFLHLQSVPSFYIIIYRGSFTLFKYSHLFPSFSTYTHDHIWFVSPNVATFWTLTLNTTCEFPTWGLPHVHILHPKFSYNPRLELMITFPPKKYFIINHEIQKKKGGGRKACVLV